MKSVVSSFPDRAAQYKWPRRQQTNRDPFVRAGVGPSFALHFDEPVVPPMRLKPRVGARSPGAGNRMIPPEWPFPSTCGGLRRDHT